MKSKFMQKLLRKNTTKKTETMNVGHFKDVLMSHLQSVYQKDIVDIDVDGLTDPVSITIYVKKGGKVNN